MLHLRRHRLVVLELRLCELEELDAELGGGARLVTVQLEEERWTLDPKYAQKGGDRLLNLHPECLLLLAREGDGASAAKRRVSRAVSRSSTSVVAAAAASSSNSASAVMDGVGAPDRVGGSGGVRRMAALPDTERL